MGIIHNNNLCSDTRFILYYNCIYIRIVHIMILYNVQDITSANKLAGLVSL